MTRNESRDSKPRSSAAKSTPKMARAPRSTQPAERKGGKAEVKISDSAAKSTPKAARAPRSTQPDGGKAGKAEVVISDFAVVNPPPIDIPAMICQPEKNYYYWLTSNHATDAGAVVEFGTWLGASSAHLAAGLKGRAMHCYDGFQWFSEYDTKSDTKLKNGDSFLPLFEENMSRWGANVIAHPTRITDASWDGGPIELLILDAPKLAPDLIRLLTVFGSSLIPGRSRIALQDYQYFPSYQIAVVMDAIRASVSLEHVVVAMSGNLQPNTVGFFVNEPISASALAKASDLKTWSSKQIHTTWARIMKPLPDQARARMAPGLSLWLYDAGHENEALSVLAETPMDRIMLKRWERLAGLRYAVIYPRLVLLMRETRLNAARKAPNAKLADGLRTAPRVDRNEDPRAYLSAWKTVLAGDPTNLHAAQKVISVARQLGEASEVVDGLIALLRITPDDEGTRNLLAGAALNSDQEQRVLDHLAGSGQADLHAPKIASLHKRVYMACKNALAADDRTLALKSFETLVRVDDQHPWVSALRPSFPVQAQKPKKRLRA